MPTFTLSHLSRGENRLTVNQTGKLHQKPSQRTAPRTSRRNGKEKEIKHRWWDLWFKIALMWFESIFVSVDAESPSLNNRRLWLAEATPPIRLQCHEGCKTGRPHHIKSLDLWFNHDWLTSKLSTNEQLKKWTDQLKEWIWEDNEGSQRNHHERTGADVFHHPSMSYWPESRETLSGVLGLAGRCSTSTWTSSVSSARTRRRGLLELPFLLRGLLLLSFLVFSPGSLRSTRSRAVDRTATELDCRSISDQTEHKSCRSSSLACVS